MNFIGLDIETAPVGGAPQEYALQPWRVLEGSAEVTAIGYAAQGEIPWVDIECNSVSITTGPGVAYATWNGVFDVAFLIASGINVENATWVDAMLLWKWVSNSQHMERMPKWSLADGAKRWLSDWPHLEKFLKMKASAPEAGDDDAYWQLRCKMDALATRLITERVWERLTPQQRRAALIEAQCIWPAANSWVNGIKIKLDLINELRPSITKEMYQIERKLDVCAMSEIGTVLPYWVPSKILRSPKRLQELIYDRWQLPCEEYTAPTARFPNGQRSTAKAALNYLSDKDDRMLDILRWRELNTQLTKFLDSPTAAAEYVGGSVLHPSPRLFSTYTGRMTYTSKIKKKFKVGLALHQMPRNKTLRKLVVI